MAFENGVEVDDCRFALIVLLYKGKGVAGVENA